MAAIRKLVKMKKTSKTIAEFDLVRPCYDVKDHARMICVVCGEKSRKGHREVPHKLNCVLAKPLPLVY